MPAKMGPSTAIQPVISWQKFDMSGVCDEGVYLCMRVVRDKYFPYYTVSNSVTNGSLWTNLVAGMCPARERRSWEAAKG